MTEPPKNNSLGEVVRWLISTLTGLSQAKGYGSIKVTVQRGQIEFVTLDQNWKLPPGPAGRGDPTAIPLAREGA